MNEFKFVVTNPRSEIDSDTITQRVAIVAKYEHHIYPIEIQKKTETHREIKFAINQLKQKLIEQIINAPFEYETDND